VGEPAKVLHVVMRSKPADVLFYVHVDRSRVAKVLHVERRFDQVNYPTDIQRFELGEKGSMEQVLMILEHL